MKLYDQIDELQVQVTRQSVGAPSVGSSGGHEQALPYDVGASNMADELRKVLTHWYIPKDTQEIVYVACMSAQIRTKWLALWHLSEFIRTARLESGPAMYAQMKAVAERSESAIDRKIAKVWVADCECGRTVRAHPDKAAITCECGETWDVAQARAEMKALGEEQLVTAREAESLGDVYGAQIRPATVRVWKHRGKLSCQRLYCENGCDHAYRFGDILALQQEKQS